MTRVPSVLQIQAYSDRLENEEREKLIKYVSIQEDRVHKKRTAWKVNKNKKGTEFHSKNFKSNVKENNVLIKKLRHFSHGQLEHILRAINRLNLSMYLSEIAEALIHCKLNISDINGAVRISSKLHLIYSDFSSEFLNCWKKHLDFHEDSPVFNRHKLKTDIVFFSELIIAGILPTKESLEMLYTTLCTLVKSDLIAHKNVDIILNFCKFCSRDFIGTVPKSMRIFSNKYNVEVPRGNLISSDEFQQKCKNIILEYFDSLCSSLTYYLERISTLENRYNDHLLDKGDVHPDKLKHLECLKKEFSSLKSYTDKLSELLDLDKHTTKKTINDGSDSLVSDIKGYTPEQLAMEVWGDKETEQFYTELPNVEEYLILTGKDSDPGFDSLLFQEITEENMAEDDEEEKLNHDEEVLIVNENEENADAIEEISYENEEISDDDEENSNEKRDISNKSGDSATTRLQLFFTNLSNCLNQIMIDNAAIEFLISYDNKQSRQKLVEYVFLIPRTRYDLFPFICRFLAIINQVHPEVVKQISDKYYKQFRNLLLKKDQVKVEIKIKNMKFIAELLKFKLFSNIYGLYCLKLLLSDFSHHHIQMACVFLESCGKLLYFSQETHCRAKCYLEQMLTRKNNVILDLKYKNMIESIYYMIIPPKVSSITRNIRKPRPVMHEFIRHLIYVKLNCDNIEFVRELVEKLDWEDVKTERYIIQCLSNASHVKLDKIKNMAILVQTLVEDYEEQMVQVIDNVLEDIRFGLEKMAKKMYQRRIAMVTYLGHLYIHCDLVGIDTIFSTLYSIISHVVHLESANDLSRVSLTLTLLDTCADHFPHHVYEQELHFFMIYFQHYFLHKNVGWENESSRFSMYLLQHRFSEILQKLYPNRKPFKSLDESSLVLQEIFQNISEKYNLNLPSINMNTPRNIQSKRSLYDAKCNNLKSSTEDETFLKEHNKLVVHSMKERIDTSASALCRDMTIPVVKRLQSEKETQCFMLLRKPNRKPLLKELSIPPDSEIMTKLISSQKCEEYEKIRLKQITLEHSKRLQSEST